MPKLSAFSSTSRSAGPVGGRAATAADFGGGGQGMMQAGADLAVSSDKMERKIEKDSLTKANLSYAKGLSYWAEETDRRREGAPPGAEGFSSTLNTDFDAWSKEQLSAEYLTPTSKAYLESKFTTFRANQLSKSLVFESASRAKKTRTDVMDAGNSLINSTYEDLSNYGESKQTFGELASIVAADNPVLAAEITKEFNENLAHKAIAGEVERDPEGALDMLGQKYWKDELSDTAYKQLVLTAETRKRQIAEREATAQNKTNANARSMVALVRDRLVNGQGLDELTNKELLDAVKASNDPDIKAGMNRLMIFKDWYVEEAKKSLPEVEASLAALPQPGQPTTALQMMQIKSARAILSGKISAVNAAASDTVTNLKRLSEASETPDETQLALAAALLKRLPNGPKRDELVAEINSAGLMSSVNRMTPDQIQRTVNALRTQALANDEKISPSEALTITMMRDYHQNMRNTLKNEGPLSWAMKANVHQISPLDPSDPDSLRLRFATVRTLKAQFGAGKDQFFLPQELDQVRESFKNMEAKDRVAFYRSMTQAGGKEAYKVFNEISEKMSPRMGYVAGMANSPNQQHQLLAAQIEEGARKLEEKGGSRLIPSSNEVNLEYRGIVGAALEHAPAGTEEGMLEAYKALYANEGLDPIEGVGTKASEAIMRKVLGAEIMEHNGAKTVLPQGMDEDKFETTINTMTPEDIASAAGQEVKTDRGVTVTASHLWSRSVFVYAGPNQYLMRDRVSKRYLRGVNGEEIVLNLTAVINK